MTRMAFLVDDLHVGGSEVFLRRLILALKEDQEVRLVGLFAGGPIGDELKEAGIPVEVLGLRKWNAPWKLFLLASWLSDWGIEILHCERLASSIFGIAAGRLAGVPKVFLRRGGLPWWPNRIYRTLDRLAMRWSDRVIANVEAIRDGYVLEQGLPPEKFIVIPNGIPRSTIRSRTPENGEPGGSEKPVLGCVANFNWRKDHATLFHAFRAVSEEFPDVRLRFVGSGPMEPEIRDLVSRSSTRDRVEFLGPRFDVEEILPEFDILVLPSHTEGFGTVLIEAMAAGVPVVATAVGGIPEVVTNDLTGLLVRPGSPEALSGAILHLLREPREARRLAENARRDVAERFTLESVVSRYRDLVGIPAPGGDRTGTEG